MRQKNDKDTAEQATPRTYNAKQTKKKSTIQKNMLFKDTVVLPPHSLFCILSHHITPDSTSNGFNSTDWQGTSKILPWTKCLVTISIAMNNNNAITVGKAVNALMKVVHGIDRYTNKVKIAPWKIKQPNMEFLKYIKGGRYPKTEVGKYVYAIREGKSREGRQYVSIKISLDQDVTWDDWYTTLRGHWTKKGEKYLKICNSDCGNPLWFGWPRRSTC